MTSIPSVVASDNIECRPYYWFFGDCQPKTTTKTGGKGGITGEIIPADAVVNHPSNRVIEQSTKKTPLSFFFFTFTYLPELLFLFFKILDGYSASGSRACSFPTTSPFYPIPP